jgi:hypothetical protein
VRRQLPNLGTVEQLQITKSAGNGGEGTKKATIQHYEEKDIRRLKGRNRGISYQGSLYPHPLKSF